MSPLIPLSFPACLLPNKKEMSEPTEPHPLHDQYPICTYFWPHARLISQLPLYLYPYIITYSTTTMSRSQEAKNWWGSKSSLFIVLTKCIKDQDPAQT